MNSLSRHNNGSSNTEQVSQNSSMELSASLHSEWESVEKSPDRSSPVNSSDGLAHKTSKSQGPNNHVARANVNNLLLVKDSSATGEEDESHLPPGVRKMNRCYSSGSSSEDEKTKGQDYDSSDSDISDPGEPATSPDHTRVSQKQPKVKEPEIKAPMEEKQKESYKKVKRGRSPSRSRSRSPNRKRRLHDHHSRHAPSGSKSRHHRTDRKHESQHSRSKEMDRSNRHRETKHNHMHNRDHRGSGKERHDNPDRTRRDLSRDQKSAHAGSRGSKVDPYGDKMTKAEANFNRPTPSKPMTFKDRMRQELIRTIEEGGDVTQALTDKDGTIICTQSAGKQQAPATRKDSGPVMNNSLNYTPGLTPLASITAAEAAMQSMLAFQKETTEKTGVEIPKYYNPAAINPMKYAEQFQKRKLLWSKNKEKDVNSQWHATTLSSDHDDKSKEKFRKLMGIKSEDSSTGDDVHQASEELKERELFDKLDKEYEYARMTTHTHRGLGLGFGSSSFHAPNS